MDLSDLNLRPSEDKSYDGLVEIPWFGESKYVQVYFAREDDCEPSAIQLQALKNLIEHKKDIFHTLQDQLLNHYATIREKAQEYYSHEVFSEKFPIINNPYQLTKNLEIKSIILGYYGEKWCSYIGLVIDCSWDTEMGVGVKIVENNIVEIGEQDIVI